MISPQRFARIYRIVDLSRKAAVVILFTFIIVSMGLQIVLRRLEWTDEILRYLNIWVVFLGAGLAVPKSRHLHVAFWRQNRWPGTQRVIRTVTLCDHRGSTRLSRRGRGQNGQPGGRQTGPRCHRVVLPCLR